MSAPLSQELFYQVHRGIRLKNNRGNKIDKSALGMHWSADEQVARDFSGINYNPETSRVIHARVPISSVETNPARLKERDVNSPDDKEKEVPVKEGAPVLVTGISRFKEQLGVPGVGGRIPVKKRTRTYNPPREMKA